MHNNEYAQTGKPPTDDSAVSKSSVIETNGSIAKTSESNEECNDYSSFEDLLNIDNFITMENNTLDVISNAFHELTTSSINFDQENNMSTISGTGVDGQSDGSLNTLENPANNNLNVSSLSDVSLALKGPNFIVEVGNKSDGQCKVKIDSNTYSINAHVQMTNFEASGSLIPNLNSIEHSNGTSTVPVAKSTITSMAQKKYFPKFIKLYCAKCGESSWTPRYYSDQKCPTCENKVTLRCCKCKQESDKYENMVYHLKTKCAPNDVKYKCSQCDYNTFLRSSMRYHLKSHEPSNNIKCPDCGISVLKNKKCLENHQRYSCPNRQQEGYMKCSHCYKKYRNEICFQKHEKNCIYNRDREEERLDDGSSHANT
ncbi:hypothetical protein TSAR_009807 [Trichomalopsis sarcophagae]|uniref:C2H2-type domain-containing protein n=1 Tax=Trichomalopsis sarcophagae TaxID=543379 RepID=A0A232ETJ7_9HYME|nr:hypothetical protein TSAR_009807 [Trichomalopsis sarcophagae]